MPEIMNKDDLRCKKTLKAMKSALLTLLSNTDFSQITISDLCKKAMISRATFYSHYSDKYEMLQYWLLDVKNDIIKDVYRYDELESSVNTFINDNKRIIKNVLTYADSRVLEIVREFMTHIILLTLKREFTNFDSPNHTVLLQFCTGGLVQLLLWQVRNNYPLTLQMVNAYLYKMLRSVTEWDAAQEREERSGSGQV